MISLYKSLHIVFWVVAIICAVGAVVFSWLYPEQVISIISIAVIFFGFTGIFIIRMARDKFKREVMALLYECRANEFLDKVDELFKDKNSKSGKSTYAWLTALGYDVLGDNESMLKSCQNITEKSHMPEYHRRMITYYVDIDEIDKANTEIEKLKILSSRASGPDKGLIEQYIGEGIRAIRIRLNDVEGMDQFYEGSSGIDVQTVLLSKVSYAQSYGKVLILKGENEKARQQLLFASKYGGDTKYKKIADTLLSQLD